MNTTIVDHAQRLAKLWGALRLFVPLSGGGRAQTMPLGATVMRLSPSRLSAIRGSTRPSGASTRKLLDFVGGLGFAAFVSVAVPAVAAVAPQLNTAGGYAVLGTNAAPTVGTVTCTNTGPGSTINGNVGTTFTSITNTGCTITGTTVAPVASTVVADFNKAYGETDTLNPTCTGTVPLTSATLAPGVYCAAAGVTLGSVTLTLNGTANDVWVFKIGTGGSGALTATSLSVVMAGTASACNVFWRTANGTTLTDSAFKGTILAGAGFTSTGGSLIGRALAKTDVTVTNAGPLTGCSAANSLPTITVNKNFTPSSAASVQVALSCTSGTTNSPQNASTATPAVFTVTGASAGATCTATETVPAGYTANQSGCVGVALGGSCTITNALNNINTITVNKNFIPSSAASVQVALSCTSGTTNSPQNASTATPAVFTVTGASAGATCTATEVVPAGYTANQSGCVGVALGGSCTITNSLNNINSITVNKNFIPSSAASVQVALSCTSGTTNSPQNASTANPAVFTVSGAAQGATCTATEVVPAGYTANQTSCVGVALGGSCTIINSLTPVVPPPLSATAVPTLFQWAVILLTLLLALIGSTVMRRRNR